MTVNNSPLESLAAFAIVFAAGVMTTAAVQTYAYWVKRQAGKN